MQTPPTYELPPRRLFAVLGVVLVVLALFLAAFLLAPSAFGQGEPDPTLTCDTAARTPHLNLPHMVANMAHPETCFNQAMDILDAALPTCP